MNLFQSLGCMGIVHYMPGGREVASETTVGEEKRNNIQLSGNTSEVDFINFRSERDKTLSAPKLLFQSVQVNIDAGAMPDVEGDKRYLKIPVNIFRPEPKGELELNDV